MLPCFYSQDKCISRYKGLAGLAEICFFVNIAVLTLQNPIVLQVHMMLHGNKFRRELGSSFSGEDSWIDALLVSSRDVLDLYMIYGYYR